MNDVKNKLPVIANRGREYKQRINLCHVLVLLCETCVCRGRKIGLLQGEAKRILL